MDTVAPTKIFVLIIPAIHGGLTIQARVLLFAERPIVKSPRTITQVMRCSVYATHVYLDRHNAILEAFGANVWANPIAACLAWLKLRVTE